MTERLDALLVRRGLAASRARARRLIEAGAVRVDGAVVAKSARRVAHDSDIQLDEPDIPYVSRAGLKLEAALDQLGLEPMGARAVDIGASTGGFTDLLLQRGARAVVTVDVGTAQLHDRLRGDDRIRVLEGTDIRRAEPHFLGAPFDWLVADLSFIGLGPVLPHLRGLVGPGATVLVLVKPQFEVGSRGVDGRGIVRDAGARQAALERVRGQAGAAGFRCGTALEVPIPGEAGNREYFLSLAPI